MDIVERLRNPSLGSPRWLNTMEEAADMIEKMRKDHEIELKEMRSELDREYYRGHSEGEEGGYRAGYDDGYIEGLEVGRAGM